MSNLWVQAVRGLDGEIVMMHPRDLLPFAEDRLSDSWDRRKADAFAKSIGRHGYDPARAKDGPIRLVHEDTGSSLYNGNTRTHAMDLIGYDRPVPVLVEDRRTTAV